MSSGFMVIPPATATSGSCVAQSSEEGGGGGNTAFKNHCPAKEPTQRSSISRGRKALRCCPAGGKPNQEAGSLPQIPPALLLLLPQRVWR